MSGRTHLLDYSINTRAIIWISLKIKDNFHRPISRVPLNLGPLFGLLIRPHWRESSFPTIHSVVYYIHLISVCDIAAGLKVAWGHRPLEKKERDWNCLRSISVVVVGWCQKARREFRAGIVIAFFSSSLVVVVVAVCSIFYCDWLRLVGMARLYV